MPSSSNMLRAPQVDIDRIALVLDDLGSGKELCRVIGAKLESFEGVMKKFIPERSMAYLRGRYPTYLFYRHRSGGPRTCEHETSGCSTTQRHNFLSAFSRPETIRSVGPNTLTNSDWST